MKKRHIFCLFLCVFLLLQCVSASATGLTDPIEDVTGENLSVTKGCSTMDAAIALDGSDKRLDTAQSAILYEMSTDTLLYAWNPDAIVYPASLVKMMTALVALEKAQPTDLVTVNNEMLATLEADEIKTSLRVGEEFTLLDLINWMLVASSNDASVVIAHHIAGGHAGMSELMNSRAKELGCKSTNFTNAHGFPDTNQFTTARDMGKILLAALKNEHFKTAFSARDYTIPATNMSEERYLRTTNYFISNDVVKKFYDNRVTGGKSGAISIKDRSLVCTAESGSVQLLGIVMGARGETEEDGYSMKWYGNFEEMTELLHYGFDEFKSAQILHSNRSLKQFDVMGGANAVVGHPVSDSFSALPRTVGTDQLSWRFSLNDTLTAPVALGDKIGTVQVWYGSVCIAQSDIAAMNSSKVKTNLPSNGSTGNYLAEDGSLMTFLKTLGIIFAVMLVLLGLFWGYVMIRRAVIRNRRNKRRRSRRRNR